MLTQSTATAADWLEMTPGKVIGLTGWGASFRLADTLRNSAEQLDQLASAGVVPGHVAYWKVERHNAIIAKIEAAVAERFPVQMAVAA